MAARPAGGGREGLARRHVQRQQGVQATRGVDGEPAAPGLARPHQELGHVPACLRWPAGQPLEPLAPWFLAAIMCMLYALPQGCYIFGQEGDGVSHRRLSSQIDET
jgi:hypothetical protein